MELKGKHLFAIARLGKDINLKQLMESMGDKEVTDSERGLIVINAIIDLFGAKEKEITELIADIKGVKAKEVAEQPIEDLMGDIKSILGNKQVQNFMKSIK